MLEYGKLLRTLHALRWFTDEAFRRRIGRQLNRGEALNDLRRFIFFANRGTARYSDHEDQTTQAHCHTLVVNTCILSCYLATFRAKRVTRKAGPPGNVRLRGGRAGLFDPRSCGGSCAPSSISWYSRGNRYEIAADLADRSDDAQRRRLVVAANSAIGAGAR